MTVSRETMEHVAGYGLTAADYAGMTPEQIMAVAAHGQKDRQIIYDATSDIERQKMEERKQDFEEAYKTTMLELMQNQDARDEFRAVNDAMLGQMTMKLQQQQLELSRMQIDSSLSLNSLQRKALQMEIEEKQKEIGFLNKIRNTQVVLPFKDAEGNDIISDLATAHSFGFTKDIVAANAEHVPNYKDYPAGIATRLYLQEQLRSMGADDVQIKFVGLYGEEALKGGTRQAMHELRSKHDPVYNHMSEEDRKAKIDEDMRVMGMLSLEAAYQLNEKKMRASQGVNSTSLPGNKTDEEQAAEFLRMLELEMQQNANRTMRMRR